MNDPRGQRVFKEWLNGFVQNVHGGSKAAAFADIRRHIREATENFSKSHQVEGLIEAFDAAWN